MEKGGGSRLLQMQARFQQKQLQEREMKIASLYEAQQARALDRVRHSPSNTSNVSNGVSVASSPPQPAAAAHAPGKVRQMFEERRTKGIDKSYPLQPIQNTDRTTRKALPNGYTKVTKSTTNARVTLEKRSTKTTSISSTHSVKKHQKIENIVNGSGDLNHNLEEDLIPAKQILPQSNGEIIQNIDETDKIDNNYLIEDETFPDALAPIPTPRSPEPQNNNEKANAENTENVRIAPETTKMTNGIAKTKADSVKTMRKSPSQGRTSPAKMKPQPAAAPPRRVISENAVTESSKARGVMQRAANPVQRRHPVVSGGASSVSKARSTASPGAAAASPAAAGGGSGAACGVCGRHFAPDRIAKHQEICKKAHAKKRKPFDVLKHRLAGTEAEPFIGKLRKSTVNPSTTKVSSKQLNSNWRQKHEEFINAIRAAKQVQAHLNAGGKLSDLPPPPPSENPDYIQCPHCNRRFNQGAAERHIPKCANFQFNKPKPAAKRR
ncbi:hypothetical protein K1T71_010957 [Dendrolimus kikuchii]|uniref:Uncharacterized protein n=1 Tax=Dendrolimus kikuchii TaxID=765133 RepID=A0ACC1CQA4_9NEOP|nr:hypothetical protein K1T71_010957 [Dendrolimus kikuchii]